MKKINLTYNEKGYISNTYDDGEFYIAQQENDSVSISATFPGMLKGSVKAYVEFPGGGDIIECENLTVNNHTAAATLSSDHLRYHYLLVGFEVDTGTKQIRFEPVTLEVDRFVNPSGSVSPSPYTVTVKIGSVTELEPGEAPTVNNVGTEKNIVLDFGIPKGEKGDKGDRGERGADGKDGINGADGKDGYTPQKGVDYFTAQDIKSLGIDDKVDKVDGKGLSTNDFTDELKNKLDGIEPNATALPMFELENGKNILIPDSESGYYDGTTPKTSTSHIRTPNPISIESGHSLLTVTTNLTVGDTGHYFCVTFLDETGTKISSPSKSTATIVNNNGTAAFEIPSNATQFLVWLSDVKTSGISNFENFSMQYDNYGIAKYEPYIEPKTVLKKNNLPYGVHPLNGKIIVNFGDSIFGNRRPPNDISTEIAKLTGATVHNCGFGGCRMSSHSSTQFDAFSMYRLANSIANNDWTLQDTAVSETGWGMPTYFPEALTLLKSIDFSKVDIITIAYGTNDFASAIGLDNAENNKDTTKFAGALRYSIETLLNAYPHLKIFVCTPIYRFWLDDSGNFLEDSDTKVYYGQKLTDYVAKVKEVAEEYHMPYIDNYNIGMNKYNRSLYFSATDGTHPLPKGGNLMAAHIAKKLF